MIKNAIPIKNKKIRIQDLPLDSRPREKLLAKGRENLTDEELIAIILGTGSVKQNVLRLSANLLRQYPLKKLANISLDELTHFPGIGKAKATRLTSAIELGNRLFSPSSFNKIVILSAEDVLNNLRDIIEKRQEYLVVFYLNARHELIQREIVGQGSLNNMVVTPREIFGRAFKTPCAFIIIAHNHPSNDPTPSEDDIEFTTKIHEAGEIMGIPMLDHLIVTKSSYFSFRENKTSNKNK